MFVPVVFCKGFILVGVGRGVVGSQVVFIETVMEWPACFTVVEVGAVDHVAVDFVNHIGHCAVDVVVASCSSQCFTCSTVVTSRTFCSIEGSRRSENVFEAFTGCSHDFEW